MLETRKKGILATVIAALLWSTAGLFIKLVTLDAFTILFYRSFFAGLLFLILYRTKLLKINKLTIIGALFYAPLVMCFVTATKLTSAANAIFLQYAAPAYVLILEPWILKTKLRPINVITVFFCLLGMSLFLFDQFERPDSMLGTALAVFGGLMLAGLMLTQRKNTPEYQVSTLFLGNLIVVIATIPWLISSPLPSINEWWILMFLGFVQLGFGFLLFTYGQRYITAIESSLLAMLEPMLNPIWVVIGYGEIPTKWAIFGGIVILGSLIFRIVWMEMTKPKKIILQNN
jgi:drug/metabolite transporter (DMT)-like permease